MVVVAELQPERRRGELRPDREDPGRLHAGLAAPQPRQPGPLPAGLDVQGRHGLGGARLAASSRPTSTFYDPGYCTVYGKRVNNFDTSRPFGNVTLATALQYSVNSVFCNIGLKLGARAIVKQAKAFGFYERPPLETPESERLPSGLYKGGELYDPTPRPRRRPGPDGVRPGAPARHAAADGDGRGRDRQRRHPDAPVRRREDRDAERQDPHRARRPTKIRRAVTPATARDVGDDDGAGRPGGHRHGGADSRASDRRQDRDGRDGRRREQHDLVHRVRRRRRARSPRFAIAVVLQNQSLTGGATAAPIARQVLQALLTSTAKN